MGGRERVDVPSCAVPAKDDTVVGAFFSCASLGPEMEPLRGE